MTTQTPQQSSVGIVFVVFLVLKLTGTIDWSWWWVTAPLWGPLALVLIVISMIGISLMIKADKQAARSWRRRSR